MDMYAPDSLVGCLNIPVVAFMTFDVFQRDVKSQDEGMCHRRAGRSELCPGHSKTG